MQKRFTVLDVIQKPLAQQLTSTYGSPLYVYRQSIIRQKVQRLLHAGQGFKISYALKANTNKHLVKIIREAGITHIDVVSPGQVHKALECGYKPQQIMYTQNFISEQQLTYSLNKGVTLNIGALSTLEHFKQKLSGKRIFVRINPKIGAGSSHHVITGGPKSKFGIYQDDIDNVIRIAQENNIHIIGLHQHIGSNIKKKDQDTVIQTMAYIFSLVQKFKQVEEVNIGGGLGVAYRDEEEISNPVYLYNAVRNMQKQCQEKFKRNIRVSVEPGRYIIADSSVLLCKITSTKKTPQKYFIGTDTGFNHLIRPALYGSHHEIINISDPDAARQVADVCGNICECTDFLGTNINLGGRIGDILGIQNAGAYGFAMSSTYNERPRPAQVLIGANEQPVLIRRRQTFEELAGRQA